jgi:putative DNA primase/helicase
VKPDSEAGLPSHSRKDRSLCVTPSATAPNGFTANSFAGDHWQTCRDRVSSQLGLPAFGAGWNECYPQPTRQSCHDSAISKQELAFRIWHEAVVLRGTLAEVYLKNRGLDLPPEAAEVLRFHSRCPFGSSCFEPCMIAVLRAVDGNAPQAIHRTALKSDGTALKTADGKTACLSLGPVKGGAIKLTADEHVNLCLGVAEASRQLCQCSSSPSLGAHRSGVSSRLAH